MSRKDDGSDERFEKLAWWRETDRMTLSRKRNLLTALPGEDGAAGEGA